MTGAANEADCVLVALRVKAPPAHAFDVFISDIGLWWRPDPMFEITPLGDGALAFEGGEQGRLVTHLKNGKIYEIGKVTAWEPGVRLDFEWRQASFGPDLMTLVEVTYEPAGDETRVTVRHFGWTVIPRGHVSRHGFPDPVTQTRAGGWWRRSLSMFSQRLGEPT